MHCISPSSLLLHSYVSCRFCKNCAETEVTPRVPRICKSIEGFIPITASDTLTLVLDALSALLLAQRGTWLSVELAETLVPAVLNVWAKGVQGTGLYELNILQ